jgi:Ca2+-binding EF-hand superfamily protein
MSTHENGVGIERKAFQNITTSNKVMLDRIFSTYDMDDDGVIGFVEFCFVNYVIWKGSLDDNIDLTFRALDRQSTGYLTKSDILSITRATLEGTQCTVRDLLHSLSIGTPDNYEYQPDQPISALFPQQQRTQPSSSTRAFYFQQHQPFFPLRPLTTFHD